MSDQGLPIRGRVSVHQRSCPLSCLLQPPHYHPPRREAARAVVVRVGHGVLDGAIAPAAAAATAIVAVREQSRAW
jgi:hypothetical protein